MDDTLELGGNIELTGFRELDPGSMIVVKKNSDTYRVHFLLNYPQKSGPQQIIHGFRGPKARQEAKNHFNYINKTLKDILTNNQ